MRVRSLAGAVICVASLSIHGQAFAQAIAYEDDSNDEISYGTDSSSAPSPGTLVVRLNGRFRFFAGLFDDQQFNRTYTSTSYTLTPSATGGAVTSKASTVVNSNQQSNYGFIEYTRLYPGFDGVTAGGLKYGANVEIRQDSTTAPGGGANGTISNVDVGRGSLYVRREWGYIGLAGYGTLRFGTEDGPSSLYLTGVFENFNDGGWNGDVRYGLVTNAQLRWPFADDSNNYTTNKIVYLSPQYMGFDFGVGFEPSTAGESIQDGNCATVNTQPNLSATPSIVSLAANSGDAFGGIGCDRLASTTVSAESARRRNTVDALLRYRTIIGDTGIGLVATGSYMAGSHVSYTGPGYTTSKLSNGTETFVKPVTYDGLSVGDFGVAATYAGVQLGGNYQFGRFNNALANGNGESLALQPVGAKPASAWTVGGAYSFGPAIIGAAWVDVDSQGAFAYSAATGSPANSAVTKGLGQRHEAGVQAGGTLKLAPGLGFFLSYLWDERSQAGYDFVSGTTGASTNNKIRAQALTIGTSLTW